MLVFSVLCSALYLAGLALGGFPGAWAVKAASVAALAMLARRNRGVAAGLALGSLGDALLDLSPQFFVAGLAAFLCGHIVYIFSFLRTGRKPVLRLPAAGVVVFAASFLVWLWPTLGPLRIPVALYVGAISVMAATSFRMGGTVPLGALLFLLSDSLLAANRFVAPLPLAGYAIWITYYAGQWLIARGCLSPQR